jgi:hypothetical protein
MAAGGELPQGYVDIYKLAVEMADRVSARRAMANSFFLSAQSILVVLVGATTTSHWALALPGLLLAVNWWLLLRSYRVLNGAKFKVVQAMEQQLPTAPFRDEWTLLSSQAGKPWRQRHFELGLLERSIPILFGLIFLAILINEAV